MYTFLVLGLIPGTNIQISFQAWLDMAAALPFVAAFIKLHLYHRLTAASDIAIRQPLHASQLHRRIRPTAR